MDRSGPHGTASTEGDGLDERVLLPAFDLRSGRRGPAFRLTGDMLLVALTGYGSEEDRRRAFAAGFDAHLLKPVDPDALHALLARDRNGRAAGEKTRTVH